MNLIWCVIKNFWKKYTIFNEFELFLFRKRKRPKLKKMSIQWTHCCWLSKHFFKDVKSIQVLSKFKNFQPLFIFVGFCSISRKKPWSIFQKFPNTLWFIFISYLFFDYRSEQIRHSHSSVWKSTQNTSRHFHLASIDFLSVIRYVQKRSLFNKSCYRGCLRDVNDKSPGVQFAMFVGNDNRCLLSI